MVTSSISDRGHLIITFQPAISKPPGGKAASRVAASRVAASRIRGCGQSLVPKGRNYKQGLASRKPTLVAADRASSFIGLRFFSMFLRHISGFHQPMHQALWHPVAIARLGPTGLV
jgi:hypothetical protein